MSDANRKRRVRSGARWVWPLIAALAVLLIGTRRWSGTTPIRDVVVVTLDTVRADSLPAYGFANLETRALDRISREGVVFEQATSSVPLTLPAHCTLFTGLFPPLHAVRDNADRPLAATQTTLAEILRAGGMHTAAFVGSAVLSSTRGLAQGFDIYSEPVGVDANGRPRRTADLVVDEAVKWIDHEADGPFFAWIHLYDAHAPYSLPEPFRTMYDHAPYLGAIAFLDTQLDRVFRVLERRQILDRTLLVVASDHGESRGDHGEEGHGIFLYQSTLRVPLIVRIPRLAPRRIPDVTRLADVMPTILDALGISPPVTDGVSLMPLMTGAIGHLDLEAYSESLYPRRFGWSPLRALRAGRFKFVSAPRPELYDLEADPAELRNIYDARRPLASAMSTRLDALSRRSSPPAEGSAMAALDPEAAAELAALGYVGHGTAMREQEIDAASVDPKDCIARYNALVGARDSAWETGPLIAMLSDPRDGCGARNATARGKER